MSANEALTHDSVRDYLIRNNGKVKNIDLVQHFKPQLNDPVNKSKARGDFKEIVNTVATVQTIDGVKYFVLKKPKEAPAVLRKPPRPTKQRDRPVSGPPTFRTAKLEEIAGGPALHLRQLSREESPDLSVSNKENDRPAERKESNHERSGSITNGSADSGVDTDFRGSIGSISESNVQMLRKQFLNSGRLSSSAGQSTDRLSYSNDDLDRVEEDIEGDDFMSGPSIRFEPLEKEWFITAARGNRAQIMCLLEQDRNLATKRVKWLFQSGRAFVGVTASDVYSVHL
ncbi:ankyrin repeat domain-containing protein SOWAHC-like isoform X1 [Acropora muricata]|uniref:ankyrin repeat domain-containing protein SOWAHC-like isoform X1 n=1 Tax=Acropora muricata TaxID=159855 RepID=UPI0034E52694